MTFGGEFVAQFDVVVDASVEHTGDPRRRIDNRLPTGGRQIDDLQTAVRQRHRAGCPGPRVVGPPIGHRRRHTVDGDHIRPPAV